MSEPKRHLYAIGWNDNKGFYGRAFLLAYTDGEAMKRFREHYNVDSKSTLSIELIARDIGDILL